MLCRREKKSHGQILKWSKNQTYTSKGIEIRIKVYKFISCCKAGRILDSILLTLPYHDKDCHLQLDLAQAGASRETQRSGGCKSCRCLQFTSAFRRFPLILSSAEEAVQSLISLGANCDHYAIN